MDMDNKIFLSSLLEVLIAELLFGDPVVPLHVDNIEALVKLEGGPQGLQEQSQFPELQQVFSILTLRLVLYKVQSYKVELRKLLSV